MIPLTRPCIIACVNQTRRHKTISQGYIYLYRPDHPNSQKKGYVAEHRLAMEEKIGRYLTKEECVHHLNGIRDDNRLENLELCSTHGEHTKLHHSDLFRRQSLEFKGKHFSPKTEFKKGDKRLLGNKYRLGLPSPNKGKKWSDEFRKKVMLARKGRSIANSGSFKKGMVPWNKKITDEV